MNKRAKPNVILNNYSSLDSEYLATIIRFVAPRDLAAKTITVNFHEVKNSWDGECYQEDRIINIVVPRGGGYPEKWGINSDFPENYLRNIEYSFKNQEDFIVFLLSHEFHHIWQFDKLEEGRPYFSEVLDYQMGIDNERTADIYALCLLDNWIRSQA